MAFDFPTAPTLNDEYTSGGLTYRFNGVGWVPIGTAVSVVGARNQPQGRLTLANLTPVMAGSISAASAIYYSGYNGDEVPLFDGGSWSMAALPGGQLSTLLTDTNYNPAPIGISKVNDWFSWSNAGTLRLCHGVDWPNDTGRFGPSGIVRINGLWVNGANITNGPAAGRGTWLGTTRSNAAGTLDWIFGTSALGGGTATLNVWNAYNRVDVTTKVSDSTASWVPNGNVISPVNNKPANRVNFVSGLAEDGTLCIYSANCTSAPNSGTWGVGIDVTNAYSGPTAWASNTNAGGHGGGVYPPLLGAHFMQALEWCNGVVTMNGDGASGGILNQGLLFKFRM